MKITLWLDSSEVTKEDRCVIIEWDFPFIPRVGEKMFINGLSDAIPVKYEGILWKVFDVEYFNFDTPVTLYLEHA